MRKISPLKFAFGISLLVHGTIFAVIHQFSSVGNFTAVQSAYPIAPPLEIILQPGDPAVPDSETQAAIETPPVTHSFESNRTPEPRATVDPTCPVTQEIEPLKAVNETADQTSADPLDNITNEKTTDVSPTGTAEDLSNPAVVLINPKPVYPLQARKRRQEGFLLIKVWVTAAGQPETVRISQTSGFELLDAAAVEAVRKWQFIPKRIRATAVPCEVEVPVRFKLVSR
jgi:protein TonB